MGLLRNLLGGAAGPYIAGAIAAVVALSAGAAVVQTKRLDQAQRALAAEQELFQQERRSFLAEKAHADRLEVLRASEHQAAVASVNDLQNRCEARVNEARRSTSAIQALLTKASSDAKADPSGPAGPELLSGRELWDAIGR